MKAPDTQRVDTLLLEFESRADPLASGDEGLDVLLEVVERHAGELMPDKVSAGKTSVGYSRAAARELFSREEPAAGHGVWLLKEDKPGLSVHLRSPAEGELHLSAAFKVLPFGFYREEALARERSQRLVALVRELAQHFPPVLAYAHSGADESMGRNLLRHMWSAPRLVHEMYWLNVYGQETVEALGRERVLATPSAHLEELAHGGVLFLTRPTPGDFDSEEARVAQARALVHLRPELSFDAVLAALRARSAALSPVERNWDPDLVELLEHTLDRTVSLKDRRRAVVQLNAYRPAPVSEWRPLSEAPESAGVEAEERMRRYVQSKVESLVESRAFMFPQMKEGRPVMTELDCYLWGRDYGQGRTWSNLEEEVIPELGAYLGEMLVRHLGGRWVACVDDDGFYVALGDRAWFPFLRVRRCLESKQAWLDYSLTKFFREAERHARAFAAARRDP
jgi:hypothetical protein